MAKHKKSEIDAILEQLKQSYATDSDLDLEDSLLESERSEEDSELASALEKIFASNPVDNVKNDTEEPLEETRLEEVFVTEKDADKVTETGKEVIEEEHVEVVSDIKSEDALDEIDTLTELSEEEEIVEDVLSMMLNPHRATSSQNHDVLQNGDDPEPEDEIGASALLTILEGNDEDIIVSEAVTDNVNTNLESIIECEVEDEEIPAHENDDANFAHDSVSQEELITVAESTEISEDDLLVEDHEDYNDESPEDVQTVFEIDESEYEDEVESIELSEEMYVSEPPKKLVLSPDEYTHDELQLPLDALDFFKPKPDIVFNNNNVNAVREVIETEESTTPVEEKNNTEVFVEDVSENDISLMLKLGYQSEISSEVGAEKTNKVILNKNERFVPDRHKIIHGFNGKEFSSKAQIQGIKKKYKKDYISLFVLAVVISIFAVVSIVLDIGIVFSSNPADFTGVIITELMIALVIGFITWRRLYSGIVGLIKFETNTYSIASLLIMEFVIYSIIVSFVYALFPDILANAVRASFGGYVFMFIALTSWGELLDCSREAMTFNMMVGDKAHYITEKHSKYFEIKRSNYVSGYFGKMNSGKSFDVSIIFMIGGLPILSIIAGVVSAIVKDDFSVGAANTALILFLSIPMTATVTASLIEFINAMKLKSIGTAFLGNDGAVQHSAISELVFNDTEAIETVSFTEINPSKNSVNAKKWLNISYNVLEALGGPFYLSLLKQRGEGDANVSHDVTINSICDNGIDLHFDSSVNVLIGDKQFMNANNIKVKTDINLTTAAKGAERSVVYFAFDGIPQIAFIITSKVKHSFNECMTLLNSNDIRVAVKSYEPQVNESFFDANISDGAVRVVKTAAYERYADMNIAETSVISSSPVELCNAVLYSRTMLEDRRISRVNRVLKAVIGFIAVCLGCVFMCVEFDTEFFALLQQGISLIFYSAMILGLIPDIIQIVKMSKRRIKDKK